MNGYGHAHVPPMAVARCGCICSVCVSVCVYIFYNLILHFIHIRVHIHTYINISIYLHTHTHIIHTHSLSQTHTHERDTATLISLPNGCRPMRLCLQCMCVCVFLYWIDHHLISGRIAGRRGATYIMCVCVCFSPAFRAYRWAARGMGDLMAAGVAVSATAFASLLLFLSCSFAGVACANGWPARWRERERARA